MACRSKYARPMSELSAPITGLETLTPSNGAFYDSYGSKSRKFEEFMEGRTSRYQNIKRWDGAARTNSLWDSLRRDPELWYRNGNCLVHLYGKGQSRRGPAFKVPLGPLLAARCQPLINKYLSRDVADSSDSTDYDLSDQSPKDGKIELYIPPPLGVDKNQVLQSQLAIRNFFAWVYRRSMVGEHLGTALIQLVDTMAEFRSPGIDNVDDVMNYLDEEGYLDMANQPGHALAVLHLAERFELKSVYIEAFAHCVGMSEQLYGCAEYQCISTITRKLIRSARADMDSRLSRARLALWDFLENELSISDLGFDADAKVHLERFRAFLLAFYTVSLGYYPPPAVDSRNSMWAPEVYTIMRADFEALYEYLVDETFTITGSSPFLAERGITVLHFVNAFDIRHRYTPLLHPLPLLPETSVPPVPRRMSWFGKRDKLRPDQRLVSHAALIRASNKEKVHLLRNSLVVAYKRFEEDSVCSRRKSDLKQKLSHADARKVRWVLIYGILQTLRSCTEVPPEVQVTPSVNYSLAVPTAHLPPWKQSRRPSSSRPMSILSSLSPSLVSPVSRTASSTLSCRSTPALISTESSGCDDDCIGFQPWRKHVSRRTSTAPPVPSGRPTSRTGNLIRRVSGQISLRSSLTWLKGGPPPSQHQPSSRRQSIYQEIILDGYGNGTKKVDLGDACEPLIPPASEHSPKPTTPLSFETGDLSTSITSSSTGSMFYDAGNPSGATTPRTDCSHGRWTCPDDMECEAPFPSSPCLPISKPLTEQQFTDAEPKISLPMAPLASSGASCSSSVYSTDEPEVPWSETRPSQEPAPPVPRRSSARRPKSLILLLCEVELGPLYPPPLRIRKDSGKMDMDVELPGDGSENQWMGGDASSARGNRTALKDEDI